MLICRFHYLYGITWYINEGVHARTELEFQEWGSKSNDKYKKFNQFKKAIQKYEEFGVSIYLLKNLAKYKGEIWKFRK